MKVLIREILEKEIEVEAENEYDAIEQVTQRYEDEEIVLSADNYVDTKILIKEEEEIIEVCSVCNATDCNLYECKICGELFCEEHLCDNADVCLTCNKGKLRIDEDE